MTVTWGLEVSAFSKSPVYPGPYTILFLAHSGGPRLGRVVLLRRACFDKIMAEHLESRRSTSTHFVLEHLASLLLVAGTGTVLACRDAALSRVFIVGSSRAVLLEGNPTSFSAFLTIQLPYTSTTLEILQDRRCALQGHVGFTAIFTGRLPVPPGLSRLGAKPHRPQAPAIFLKPTDLKP